ncbi:MAG: acyl CoA:acetate/3-ketoacid CoA transferase, partial [Boseongicola sp.]|nr:acyl CoA:acetate/3-ketoacid CoA transferase [Boseongicola sp.]
MSKTVSASEAVSHVADNAVVAVNSSSGLCCPDAVLAALGQRFEDTGAPKNLTSIHPIAAGDFFGTKGVDHIAKPGCLSKIVGGSYPSGPTKAEPPKIWQMIVANEVKAYNVPSGIVFDMLREGAGHRHAVQNKVGMDQIGDPELEGCEMNEAERAETIV